MNGMTATRACRVAVAPAMRGQGLARPLTALMIQEAFSTPGIERLELNVYMFNQPACAPMKRWDSSSKACAARRRGSASSDGIPASWGCCVEWQAGAGQHGVSSLTG